MMQETLVSSRTEIKKIYLAKNIDVGDCIFIGEFKPQFGRYTHSVLYLCSSMVFGK
jgi:hypothetical protein